MNNHRPVEHDIMFVLRHSATLVSRADYVCGIRRRSRLRRMIIQGPRDVGRTGGHHHDLCDYQSEDRGSEVLHAELQIG